MVSENSTKSKQHKCLKCNHSAGEYTKQIYHNLSHSIIILILYSLEQQ